MSYILQAGRLALHFLLILTFKCEGSAITRYARTFDYYKYSIYRVDGGYKKSRTKGFSLLEVDEELLQYRSAESTYFFLFLVASCFQFFHQIISLIHIFKHLEQTGSPHPRITSHCPLIHTRSIVGLYIVTYILNFIKHSTKSGRIHLYFFNNNSSNDSTSKAIL